MKRQSLAEVQGRGRQCGHIAVQEKRGRGRAGDPLVCFAA